MTYCCCLNFFKWDTLNTLQSRIFIPYPLQSILTKVTDNFYIVKWDIFQSISCLTSSQQLILLIISSFKHSLTLSSWYCIVLIRDQSCKQQNPLWQFKKKIYGRVLGGSQYMWENRCKWCSYKTTHLGTNPTTSVSYCQHHNSHKYCILFPDDTQDWTSEALPLPPRSVRNSLSITLDRRFHNLIYYHEFSSFSFAWEPLIGSPRLQAYVVAVSTLKFEFDFFLGEMGISPNTEGV